jgi:hypothetical protein
MGFAESSVTKNGGFWAQMGCDLWATLPAEWQGGHEGKHRAAKWLCINDILKTNRPK